MAWAEAVPAPASARTANHTTTNAVPATLRITCGAARRPPARRPARPRSARRRPASGPCRRRPPVPGRPAARSAAAVASGAGGPAMACSGAAVPDSIRIGAGCSGSPPPGSGGWSQWTTCPSEYVCVAGRLTDGWLGSVTKIRNSANWSGDIPTDGAAVQVTELVVPAATLRSRRDVQPGITSALADATFGSATLSCVVRAPVSDSPGTWNVSTAVLPGAAWSAATCTWAQAGAAPEIRAMDVAAPMVAVVMRARENARWIGLMSSCCLLCVGRGWSVSELRRPAAPDATSTRQGEVRNATADRRPGMRASVCQ